MAARLTLYNEALRLLGERRLTSTSETRDARYHLDDAYDRVVAYCLEQGYWNFAMRAVSMTESTTITVAFGYAYAFEKPTDWVRTYIISASERLEEWIFRLNDEAGVWFTDVTPLYARYVSNDASYGMNLGAWPETYSHYVACRMALEAGPSICSMSGELTERIDKAEKRAKSQAMAKDAMNEPPAFPPVGTWVRARGNRFNRWLEPSPGRVIP